MTRDIGLALALFCDCGTPRLVGEYDLKSDLETELGIPIEQFVAMGYLAFCTSPANHQGIPGSRHTDSKIP